MTTKKVADSNTPAVKKKSSARVRRITCDENTRNKIRTTHLIKRLDNHIHADEDLLSPSQVAAALGLLKKTLPDLKAVELQGEVEHKGGLTITWQQ